MKIRRGLSACLIDISSSPDAEFVDAWCKSTSKRGVSAARISLIASYFAVPVWRRLCASNIVEGPTQRGVSPAAIGSRTS